MDDIAIVDAHHHLWNLNGLHYPFLTDEPKEKFFLGDNSPIRKNFLPEDYRRVSARHNVIKTVHVEAECNRNGQVAESEWISEINGVELPTYIDWMTVCCAISVTGLPAISVPAGFTSTGLPVGLQILGKPRGDLELLRIAHAFEQATMHRRPPTSTPPLGR